MLGSNEGWQRAERQSIALRRTNREVSVRWEGPCRKGSGGLPGQGAGGGEGSKTACRCLGPPLRAQLASWKPGPTSRCFPERGPPAPLSPHELNRVMPQKGDRDQSEWTATLGDLQLPQEGAPGHRGFWGDRQIQASVREAPAHLSPTSIVCHFFCLVGQNAPVHFHLVV